MNEPTGYHKLKPLLHEEEPRTRDVESYVPPAPPSSQPERQEGINENPPVVIARPVSSNPNEEVDLSQLPPLISYFSFIKYGWAFGKWLLLVVVINIVTLMVTGATLYNLEDISISVWKPCVISYALFLTSMWFYNSAKILERDLEILDRLAQYEEGRQPEEEEETMDRGEQNETTEPGLDNHFDLNYDNIYGRVSRYIDNAWSQFSSPPLERQRATTPAVSSLVNLAYVMWALFATASVYVTTILIQLKTYGSECDDYVDYFQRHYDKISCVMEHGTVFEIVIICSVLLACSAWMIFREGVPSGIVPIIYIPVFLYCQLVYDPFPTLLITVGTIIFHIVICCGNDSRTCNLPSWINREMSIWAIYSYLTAFLFSPIDYDDYHDERSQTIVAIVCILLTAIILEHPLLNLIGIILILSSTVIMLVTFDSDLFVIILCGFGLIGVSGFLFRIRRSAYVLACYRALVQCVFGRLQRQP